VNAGLLGDVQLLELTYVGELLFEHREGPPPRVVEPENF
jgi:hypothetical protein